MYLPKFHTTHTVRCPILATDLQSTIIDHPVNVKIQTMKSPRFPVNRAWIFRFRLTSVSSTSTQNSKKTQPATINRTNNGEKLQMLILKHYFYLIFSTNRCVINFGKKIPNIKFHKNSSSMFHMNKQIRWTTMTKLRSVLQPFFQYA